MHLIKYPFQSITTILNRSVDLEKDSLYGKLVDNQLGGYCYELNGLFLALLRHLGHKAKIITGIVIIDNQFERRNARTHMGIMVTVAEQNYLVDVGFGGLVPTAPLLFGYNQNKDDKGNQLLEASQIQTTPHGRYKIIKDDITASECKQLQSFLEDNA